jgi:hypothetical protein
MPVRATYRPGRIIPTRRPRRLQRARRVEPSSRHGRTSSAARRRVRGEGMGGGARPPFSGLFLSGNRWPKPCSRCSLRSANILHSLRRPAQPRRQAAALFMHFYEFYLLGRPSDQGGLLPSWAVVCLRVLAKVLEIMVWGRSVPRLESSASLDSSRPAGAAGARRYSRGCRHLRPCQWPCRPWQCHQWPCRPWSCHQ